MIKVIPITTEVEVNYMFVGIIVSIQIRKDNICYEVQKTTEDGFITIWANDWEITSHHKENTIINQCLLKNN